jgi:hypothetical protein
MHFEILKKPELIKAAGEVIGEAWRKNQPPGTHVCVSMPALERPFPKIRAVALEFEHGYRQQFHGTMYRLKTNDGYVEELVPAAAFVVRGFGNLALQRFAMEVSSNRVVRSLADIAVLYGARRETMPTTGQPHVLIEAQLYEAASDLGHFLYDARSLLDALARMLPFFYGPKQSQLGSFADYVTKVIGKDGTGGSCVDEGMRQYLTERGEWFKLLRDLRDYGTHTAPLPLWPYEQADGTLRLYVHNRYNLLGLLETVSDGVDQFLEFCDEHFERSIKEWLAQHAGA